MSEAAENAGGELRLYRGFEMVIGADRPLPLPALDPVEAPDPEVWVREQPGLASELDAERLGRLDARGCGIGYGGWVFDLRLESGEIAYAPHPEAESLIAFEHVLERMILPIYASIRPSPRICLHAGAVERDGVGWLFIGPTGAGKSTTVYHSIAGHGARAHSDEMAVVDTEALTLLAGAPAIRLPADPDQVPEAVDGGRVHPTIAKHWFRFEDPYVGRETVPLAGIVCLAPGGPGEGATGETGRAGQLELLEGREALLAVLGETFDFERASAAWKRRRFRGASRLSGGVTVWRYRFDPDQPADRRVAGLWRAVDRRVAGS